jgi:hypothetical protein|tara:strand:+ start:1120 stop:1431 length:312 start_codon:yes stop_codon:yes gene_type:complete
MKFMWAASTIITGTLLISGASRACPTEVHPAYAENHPEHNHPAYEDEPLAQEEDALAAPTAPVVSVAPPPPVAYAVRVEATMESLETRLDAITATVEKLAGER